MLWDFLPESGIALVVPGYFVCAGILLFASATAAVVGLYRRRVPLYYVFALACLASAGMAMATGSYYLSGSVASAVGALRWLSTTSIALVCAIVVFIGMYTHADWRRGWVAALLGLFALLAVANHVLPFGIRFTAVTSFGFLHFPWGESLFRIEGEAGAANLAYRGLIAAAGAWSIWRLVVQYRGGERREARMLALCLFILSLASIQGALIDHGVVDTFHWSAFALVLLAMLAGGSLVLRLREQNLELAAIAAELARENEARHAAVGQLRERAFRDPLTGLPNRAFVVDHLGGLIERGQSQSHGAVLILDIDHFKTFNDALSHAVGDDLLREVSSRLLEAAASRALVARVDGNAFMAVLEGLCAQEAEARDRVEALAADFARALARPFDLGGRSLTVLASTGVATFPVPGAAASEIAGRAEMALQRAKKRGRNHIQAFHPQLQQEAAERHAVVQGLRHAVDAGELALHYQPQVDRDGAVIGAEALMRWTPTTRAAVSPAVFIPIAEEAGLIHVLGEWSLRAGCDRLARWKRAGVPFAGHLAVNVSPWQLARPDFVERARRIVEECGADPGRLTFEITESAVLFDVQETVAKLRELRPLGVRIALDDFGTGYSSLALIKDLPLDAIKIDQSFVRRLDEGANAHLVRLIVAIGAELGLEIIAEGVETAADRERLLALGCERMQGYHFARPMPAEAFADWIGRRQPAMA